jgi:hypothetical protein
METTLPKKSEVNFVEKIVGIHEYHKRQQGIESAEMFGVALTSLSKEELQVALLMLRAALHTARSEMDHVQIRSARLVGETNELIAAIGGSVVAKQNPFKPGDWVRLMHPIRDSYQEIWHDAGAVMQVTSIASDGEGLMFDSQLGIHFSIVSPASAPE